MTHLKAHRGAIVLLVVISCASLALASSALIRTSPHAGQSWLVQTYAGTAGAVATLVRPSPVVTVLILSRTLGVAERRQVKNDLLDFYAGMHGHPVQIGFLGTNGELTVPVAVTSRTRLEQLLERSLTGEDVQTVPSGNVLDDLVAAVPKLGPKHSAVMLVGEFPKLDPASTGFASALLVRTFMAQQLRASLFSPIPDEEWSTLFHALGGVSTIDLKDLPSAPASGEAFLQFDWTPTSPPAGFVISNSTVSDELKASVGTVPDIAQAEGVILPSIQQYADIQKKIAEAETLLVENLTQTRADRIRENIAAALQLNSRDAGALSIATTLYEKAADYPDAVKMSGYLLEVSPQDGQAYARFGHELRLNSEIDRADTALKKASELGITSAPLNEDFARLHLAKKDDKGALPYFQEVLKQDGKRQDIWFLQGQTAERCKDTALAKHSYEQGLALGGIHVAEVGSLLRLYIAGKQSDQVTQLARSQLTNLPPAADDRVQLASILDELHQGDFAMQGWRSVLAVQPSSERAHVRIARLLLESGNAAGAEEEAVTGLAAVPNSALLHLVKADAEQYLGRLYDGRHTLQEGVASNQDLTLAAQLASLEERFFGGAPLAYARLTELSAPSSPEQLRALERGFDMSMRDGDLQQAAKFASALESSGEKGYRALLGDTKAKTSLVVVPGGLSALAFAAHASKEEIPPERFFLEYCRTLMNGGVDVAGKNQYIDGIKEYFEHLADLRALGTNSPGEVTITLSLADKKAKHKTEKALNVLGIRLKSSKGEVELSQGEKKSQAIKQETAVALALDEVGIQDALQSGKSYRLVFHDEKAAVFPSEPVWRDALNLRNPEPGGFAEELLHVPHMVRTYISLNSMDHAAAEELLKAVPLRQICDHESDLLVLFAPALALEGTHAAVPGGAKAEVIWAGLVGVSPATPGPFFRALMTRDDGKLLVYFSILAQLDRPHQAFFTANERRVKQFYHLLTSTRQMKLRPYGELGDSGFQRMLRSVPLDEEGHVEFPGSAEVWTVAKGTSSDERHTAHLMKKVHKAATPEVEDAVLARLTETQYTEKSSRLIELDNFLAVSSIDLHRKEPMDEQSALLLAQKYADYATVYPYLTDLRTLTADDYRQFFSALGHIEDHPTLDANSQLGELHALTEWICLLVQRHTVKDEDATELIRKLSSSFVAAEDGASYASASLESARAILRACKLSSNLQPDEALRACLLGRHASADANRLKDFMQVLDAQHVPSLSTLLQIYDALLNLASDKPSLASVDTIQKALDGLPAVEFPKESKVVGAEKNAILRYDPAPLRKVAAQLKEKTTKKKVNPKDIQRLARELQGELQAQVTAALSGPIYGYFLRSSDAIVMNDPLLLRKHHYFNFTDQMEHQRIIESDFVARNEAVGSYFVGGFAQFAYATSVAAMQSKHLGGSWGVLAGQLATIRSTDWDRIDESCQRLVALRIIVAREWIYESARKPEVLHALADETMGLLSLSRRAALLDGIASRDWRRVWDSMTLPEMFALGARYYLRFPTEPWPSEAAVALRASEKTHTDGQLNVLGPIPTHIFGCNHPHLLSVAPYEEYERKLPAEIGERLAEFKLFLVFQNDRLGLQPNMLGIIDETLAVKAFRKAQMTDYSDWRSLLNAYASVSPSDLEQAIRND